MSDQTDAKAQRAGSKALTDAKAKAMKAGSTNLADGTLAGLRLEPSKTKNGRGKWIIRFVSPTTNARRDMGLGTYPEVSIVKARELARKAREQISAGIDPVEARKAETAAQQKGGVSITFEQAARRTWEAKKPAWRNSKHAAQWIRSLETHVFPRIGSRDVFGLTGNDFRDALDPIWLKKPETASRVKQRCHDTIRWCQANDFLVNNPIERVTFLLSQQPPASERVQHQPAMAWNDIPSFVAKTLRTGTDVSRIGLEFIILTAMRTGEVRGATWDEIDFDKAVWAISAARMKGKRGHRVPLSTRAIEILKFQQQRAQHPTLVFPSPTGKMLTDMAFTSFLRKHKVESTTKGRTATSHGFRSSFRDWASQNRYPRDLAENALAHTIKDKTEAAYHRTDLLEERREMMQKWCDWVTSNCRN